ncbi:carboxypeptidase-like regulatory domain-containing protein [Niabella ginsengisoli]|uniref:Carboxypeptidase-like regulatory domain-containing protein n=1 Tax=Niabella ginsengisoli TaxID=522298 RepID=A0ABS9SKR7_9BACT|nr:carboxypeptidase-like regulatory domain-containing protein [Niabella ginsengisoli]MCH5598974.1 carboxypeptidase-like regulatory domain-containing protein [Niabella ginsengisoli]
MRKVFLVALLFLLCMYGYAQKSITGTVKDDAGKGLAGVSVAQKDATNATMTEEDGSFKFVLDDNKESVLLFSMIGFENKEVALAGAESVQVTLVAQTKDLEQVVVVGYGIQRKASVTGAISNVGAEDIRKAPVASVTNSLTGFRV